MSNMNLIKAKNEIENSTKTSSFRSSRSPSYAIRPALPPSHSFTTYAPHHTTSTPPTPLYTQNKPLSTTFGRLLFATCLPKSLLPQSPNPVQSTNTRPDDLYEATNAKAT